MSVGDAGVSSLIFHSFPVSCETVSSNDLTVV